MGTPVWSVMTNPSVLSFGRYTDRVCQTGGHRFNKT
jgi:hypothetical protein